MFYKERNTAERVICSSYFQEFLVHQMANIGDFNMQVRAAGIRAFVLCLVSFTGTKDLCMLRSQRRFRQLRCYAVYCW